MLIKSLLICGACVGLGVATPALTPPTGSATERFLRYGLVSGFAVKLSQEQDRWAALQASGRMQGLRVVAQEPVAADCCGGIPPWHVIKGVSAD